MKYTCHKKPAAPKARLAVAVLGAIMVALPNIIFAVEDGLSTNVVNNIRIRAGGVIELNNVPITNWEMLTNNLNSYYIGSGSGAVTNQNIAVGAITGTNIAQGGISNYNIADSAITSNKIDWSTIAPGVADGSVVSNWANYPARQNVNMDGNSLSNSTQVERWNNVVVMRKGGGDPLVASNLYYYTGGSWAMANATTIATARGLLGLALGISVTNDGLLLNGCCTNNAWGFGADAVIYMATNDGAMTTNMPTGTNQIVRIMGYAISDTEIYFNPDRTYIEILGQ